MVNYDAIIKLETSHEDEAYVLNQSKLNQYIDFKYSHYKTNDIKSEDGKTLSTKDLRPKYFSNLTCTQYQELKKVYQMDLEIFDYSVDPFESFCV